MSKELNQYIVIIEEGSLFPEIEEAEVVLVPAVYQCRDGLVVVTRSCDWEEVRQFFFCQEKENEDERNALIEKLTGGRNYKALDYYNFDHNSEDEAGILENDPSCRGVEIDLMSADSCADMLVAGFVPPRTAQELMKNSYFSSYFPAETHFIRENIEEVQAEIDKLEGRKFFWIYEIGVISA